MHYAAHVVEPGDSLMGKRVLVAVDSDSSFEGSIIYGIQLAARIESGLVVIAGSRSRDEKSSDASQIRLKDLDSTKHGWLEHAVDESLKHSLSIEIFITTEKLFEEVARFVQSQPTIQFIVVGAQTRKAGSDASNFKDSLMRLRTAFEGEILVVEKAGHVSRVSDEYPQNSAKGNSI
jgi:hypothetical protein